MELSIKNVKEVKSNICLSDFLLTENLEAGWNGISLRKPNWMARKELRGCSEVS